MAGKRNSKHKLRWHQRPDSSKWSFMTQVKTAAFAIGMVSVINLFCTGTLNGDASHLKWSERWSAQVPFKAPLVESDSTNTDGFITDEAEDDAF